MARSWDCKIAKVSMVILDVCLRREPLNATIGWGTSHASAAHLSFDEWNLTKRDMVLLDKNRQTGILDNRMADAAIKFKPPQPPGQVAHPLSTTATAMIASWHWRKH